MQTQFQESLLLVIHLSFLMEVMAEVQKMDLK